jgi:hypothetical protein
MTSEVLLMNLEAVVLGSDSAVTMFDAAGRPFSQSGAEKIFMINAQAPVAAMVYGMGMFAGYPWKTVLDDFAKRCGPQPLTMRAYAEKLVLYLSGFGAEGPLKLEGEIEDFVFALYLRAFLLDYRQWLEIIGWKAGTAIDAERAAEAMTVYSRQVLYLEPETEDQEQLTPRPRLLTGDRLKVFLAARFAPVFARELGRVFPSAPFPESQVEPLAKLAVQSIMVEWLPAHAGLFTTGLVMAGFGLGSAVPSRLSMSFFGPFGGIVKYAEVRLKTPRAGIDPVTLETFAQADLTQAFLHGAMPAYEANAYRVQAHLLSDVIADVLRETAAVNKPLAQKLAGMLQDVPYQYPAIAAHVARRVREQEVSDKVWPQLNAATAETLGTLAAKLMEIPVLEHELLREDGVGRPIVILTMKPGRFTFHKDGAGPKDAEVQ